MTGQPTNGKWHIKQLVDGLRGVANLLNSGTLETSDRIVAEQTLTFGKPAVAEFDRTVATSGMRGLPSNLYRASVERFGSNIALTALGSQDAGIVGLNGTDGSGIPTEGVGEPGPPPPEIVPPVEP